MFRDEHYLCLSSFTDNRHSQTIVTALPWRSEDLRNGNSPDCSKVTVIRFLRAFQVKLITRGVSGTSKEVLEMNNEELRTVIKEY